MALAEHLFLFSAKATYVFQLITLLKQGAMKNSTLDSYFYLKSSLRPYFEQIGQT